MVRPPGLVGSGLAALTVGMLGWPLLAPATVPQPPPAAEQAALTATLPTLPPAAPLGRSRPVWLQAPEIGRVDGVQDLGLGPDGALQVARGAHAVGWYAGGAAPGQPGPAVLVGHVTWNGRPAVFYPLGRLRPGQLIRVGRADGRVATFRVRTVESHPKHQFPTRRVYGPTPGPAAAAGDLRRALERAHPHRQHHRLRRPGRGRHERTTERR